MSESSSGSSGGIGILGIFGVVFVVLKLCHVIDWSWWWVTAPFWGSAVLRPQRPHCADTSPGEGHEERE